MKVVYIGESEPHIAEIESIGIPITIGKVYDGRKLESKSESRFHLIVISEMDNGQWGTFPSVWFKPLDEQRSDRINEVLK